MNTHILLQFLMIALFAGVLPIFSEEIHSNKEENHVDLANSDLSKHVSESSFDGSDELKEDKRYRLAGKRYRLHGKRSTDDELVDQEESEGSDLDDIETEKRYRLMGKRYRLYGKKASDRAIKFDIRSVEDNISNEKRYRLMGKRYRLMGKRSGDESNEQNDDSSSIEQLEKRYRLMGKRYRLMG